jgi:hypothetical protein
MRSRAEIAEQDRDQLKWQRDFRVAADAVAAALSEFAEVEAIALFGSVAQPLAREVLRFQPYHRFGIFAPDHNRNLGRLCYFAQCPKRKQECRVEGCGATPFLQQHEDFVLAADHSQLQ